MRQVCDAMSFADPDSRGPMRSHGGWLVVASIMAIPCATLLSTSSPRPAEAEEASSMTASPSPDPMVAAASAFLKSLDGDGRKLALIPFSDSARVAWSYLPGRRAGLRLGQMSSVQREAAMALVRSGLSELGYQKTTNIVALEEILGEIERNPTRRDPELYTLSVFGEPGATDEWGWRIEGHHVSFNFTAAGGEVLGVTPAFLGANPAKVPRGPRAGWRVLAAEEDLGRALLGLLDGERRRRAILSERAPRDIITGMDRKARLANHEGLPFREMNADQQTALLRLVDVYVQNLRSDLARGQMDKIREAGVDRLRFAWAGGAEPGHGHYYRIQGPSVLIEYDNTQNDANHIHSVLRDPTNDFGDDALRRHYEESGPAHDHP